MLSGALEQTRSGTIKALTIIGSVLCFALAGCGSPDDEDDGDDGSSGGVPTATTGPGITTGGTGVSGGTSGGTFSGGVRPITDAEEDAIEDVACAGWSGEPEPLPSRLMLVVDVSSSMSHTTPATGGRTKWEVTRAALLQAVSNLPGSATVGLLLYPNKQVEVNNSPGDVNDCLATEALVPFDILGDAGSQHRELLLDVLDDAELNTSTPTHDAYATALESVMAAPASGTNTFMLLITDGQPTLSRGCVNEDAFNPVPEGPIVNEITYALEQGIRTFVIGSPGSEENVSTMTDARPWLSYAAEEGGTSKGDCSHRGEPYCHFDMTTQDDFSAALNAALAEIVGQVVQCNYSFPTPPAGETINPNAINVVYTPTSGEKQLVLRASDANCSEGYYLTADNEVQLCAQTCDQVLADGGASLNVHFGCEIIVDTIPE